MGIRDRLSAAARALMRPQAANTLTQMTIEDLVRAIRDANGGVSLSGVSVTAEKAMGVAAVYACISYLSTTISHLPLVLFRQDGNRRVPDTENPLYWLLHTQPNEWQTSLEFRELLERDLDLRGNAYAMIVTGFGGRVVELIRLHPDHVEPQQDLSTLTVTYKVTRLNGKTITLPRDEVLHIRGAGDDGVKGKSPIHQHRETIGDSIALREHGSRFFSSGAKPLGAVEWNLKDGQVGEMGQASRKAMMEDFEEVYRGGENAHKLLVVPFGLTYKPVSISMEDAQYIEGRKFTRSEIFGIFGVPPHKGGDLERATFTNIEHQALEVVIDAIVPRCVRIEQAIQRDLLPGDRNRYVKHTVDGLLRGDSKSRAESLQIKRRNGVINANEWREIDDMNPRNDEGGDEYIVEQNMRANDGSGGDETGQPTQTPET